MLSTRMKNLNPYVPGEQPKDKVYIKINANENPYPPSPKVKEALKSFIDKNIEKIGLYPDPDSIQLHKAIAKMLNQTGGVLCRANCIKKEDGSIETKAVDFGAYYALPSGFGVNLCDGGYVYVNLENLQSRYIGTIPGGNYEKRCIASGGKLIGECDTLVVYDMKP